ncbi:hypothetical protein N0V90_008041 [Kalmusia sp. IMI 367209]|nr:hypothetical protein N0V90_008041 [Kalmusia sp. IMI 367209]
MPDNGPTTFLASNPLLRNERQKTENVVERRLSGTTSLTDESPVPDQLAEPGYPTPGPSGSKNGPDTVHRSSSNVVSYLGRLEYLRNDVPVNDDAGLPNKMPRKLTDTDLAILRAQRVDELPPRAIRDSLIDAFWTRCYPWTPVVDRTWLEQGSVDRGSLLLEHAIMLAGSRVSSPLEDYPPIEFYKKAKVLFWMGTEEDPIITIAATLLLHWWNPEGPESDLTQSHLRKHGLQEQKRSLEDRLFRWMKTLPDHLQLCHLTDGRPLKAYNFETWQLHIQYFTVVVILNRSPDGKSTPSTASLLASSFIAGIFEDLMAKDQLQYLGPIFTFYCLTAGMAQLSCYRYSGIVGIAEKNLSILGQALEDLSQRWPSAVGSLKHLMDVREKVMQRPSLGQFPDVNLPAATAQFFSDFGPDLCRMWIPIHQRLPQTTNIAPRELETAGILQGLRTPATQSIDLDITTAALQQQVLHNQIVTEVALEPTMLQPQEWLGPYGGMGNWLMVDWDQGLGWCELHTTRLREFEFLLSQLDNDRNSGSNSMVLGSYWNLRVDRHDKVYVITMQKAPENRINVKYAQEIIKALREIEQELGSESDGCVIIRGNDEKFWCTGLDLDEVETNPHANADGFFPLLATILDYPFPTIALITGHTFGGACPFSLAHDYRIMNSKRGYFCMPPVDLGLHFPGIGFLPRLKLRPQIARKMLLEAHKWTGKEALEDGIVDVIAEPSEMLDVALKLAREIQGRAKMGVYSLLRNELWGEAADAFRRICHVHGKPTNTPPKAKI